MSLCSLDFLYIDQVLSSDTTSMTSTFSFNNSTQVLSITPSTSNFNYSTVKHRSSFPQRNGLITVTTSGGCGGNPQLHLRYTNPNNIGMVFYIDDNTSVPTFVQMNAGAFNNLATGPQLSPFSTSNNYQLVVKTFENLCHGLVLSGGLVVSDNTICGNSFFAGSSSISNGIGASSNTQAYTNVSSQRFNNYTNFLCIGDSNTAGVVGPYLQLGEHWVQQLNTNYINSPVTFNNCGFSGDTTYETLSGFSSRIQPKFVQGANNIAMIYIGTNDVSGNNGHTYNLANSVSNLTTIISNLKAMGVAVWLLIYQPRNDNSTWNVNLNVLNDSFRKVIGVDQVIELWESFIDTTVVPSPVGNELAQSSLLQSDGLHLSVAGNNLITSLVGTAVSNYFTNGKSNSVYQSTTNVFNSSSTNPYNFIVGTSNALSISNSGITGGTLNVTGNTTIGGTLNVTGATAVTTANVGTLNVTGTGSSANISNLTVGPLTLSDKESITQSGSITSSVTGTNKSTTLITTVTMSIATNGNASFTFNNTKITTSSIVRADIIGFTGTLGSPTVYTKSTTTGSATLNIHNAASSGTLNGTLVICVQIN